MRKIQELHEKQKSDFLIQDYSWLLKILASNGPLHLFLYVFPVIALLNYALKITHSDFSLFLFVTGLIYWSFFEYAVHRWLYHTKFRNPFANYIIGSFHTYHHSNINDHSVLNSGPLMIILVAPSILLPFAFILTTGQILSMSLGLFCFYFFYECVHYLIHYREYKSGYLSYIQKYHLFHHDYALTNFGNTSHIWDILLRTYADDYRLYKMSNTVSKSMITYKEESLAEDKSETLNSSAHDYQYLFIGGILGEGLQLNFIGQYLKENKNVLIKLGIQDTLINYKTFNSLSISNKNADSLFFLLNTLYKKNNKKIILIGHSKGAIEVIFCLIRNFSNSEKLLHKVICSNPPFAGSHLFKKMNSTYFSHFSYLFLNSLALFIPSLKCLKPHTHQRYLSEEINKSPSLKKFIKERLLVIRGYKTENKSISWILKPSYRAIRRFGEHNNDGLLTSSDQMLTNVSYKEIVMDIDHSDLFTSKLLSTRSHHFRLTTWAELINWSSSDIAPELFEEPFESLNKNLFQSLHWSLQKQTPHKENRQKL